MYISEINVNNFRSLIDVSIKGIKPISVFHGENNSGKSNILAFLQYLFSRKENEEILSTGPSGEPLRAPVTKGAFWTGVLPDFRDNFFRGEENTITFTVKVTFKDLELVSFKPLLSAVHRNLGSDHDKILTLQGRITAMSSSTARMELLRASFQQTTVIYQNNPIQFFPTARTWSAEDRRVLFEELMNMLADAFQVFPANRYIMPETVVDVYRGGLVPEHFVAWLNEQYLSREGHAKFLQIQQLFGNDHFKHGNLSFGRNSDGQLEIMINRKEFREPLNRVGSGHQQILFLISALSSSVNRMLGLEEIEINLSPQSQDRLFTLLVNSVYTSSVLKQAMITSHSDRFDGRPDVQVFEVTHDEHHTSVSKWTKAKARNFYKFDWPEA